MKTNSFIGRTGLWAVGLCLLGWAALAVSCTGMGREELTQGENASLTVTLSGQVPVSKAVGSPDDAEAVKEAENKLHNVTVFVFQRYVGQETYVCSESDFGNHHRSGCGDQKGGRGGECTVSDYISGQHQLRLV